MNDPGSSRGRGRAVEAFVADYLEKAGLQILERNVELASAELDLVALDDRSDETIYVFIEVRSRGSTARGTPVETIGRDKQARLVRAATAWLVRQDLWERVPVRFDVVGVVTEEGRDPVVEWIVDALRL